jgi:hypothetical protein
VRQKAVVVLLLVLLCYILGLVTAFYFPGQLGAVLTTVLQGKIRPFVVSRNFNETIGYVTDRNQGLSQRRASYLANTRGKPCGLITSSIPQHYPAGARSHQCDQESRMFRIRRFSSFFKIGLQNLWSFGSMVTGFHSGQHSVLRQGARDPRYRAISHSIG